MLKFVMKKEGKLIYRAKNLYEGKKEKRSKDRFKNLYERRFTALNISSKKGYSEFFINLIENIEEQYNNNIKKSDNPKKYLEKEKIRLIAEMELLKSRDLDMSFKYMHGMYSIIIPIIASAVGFVFLSSKSTVDFAIQNAGQLKNNEGMTNSVDYNSLAKIYADYNAGNVNFISNLILYGIVFISILFIISILIENHDKNNNSTRMAFDRMCLEVLENIKL